MRTKGMKVLMVCATVNVAAMARCSEIIGYVDRVRELNGLYGQLEANIGDFGWATSCVMTFAQSDGMNLASEGLKEALEWTRKYVALYPPKETEAYGSDEGIYPNFAVKRKQIFAYLAFKGDARDLEVVKQFNSEILGALLEQRVTGVNVFGYDAEKLKPLMFVWRQQTFFPSVANTGPQAVYVREILYRYWEGVERDASKIPDELRRMVVSFDKDGNPVCNVDLAKYGLSMPVITPKPAWGNFTVYKEVLSYNVPPKFTAKFPDLAEAVEITNTMKREAPDWKGLYKHVKKIPPPAPQ